jgi:hypothetical protein
MLAIQAGPGPGQITINIERKDSSISQISAVEDNRQVPPRRTGEGVIEKTRLDVALSENETELACIIDKRHSSATEGVIVIGANEEDRVQEGRVEMRRLGEQAEKCGEGHGNRTGQSENHRRGRRDSGNEHKALGSVRLATTSQFRVVQHGKIELGGSGFQPDDSNCRRVNKIMVRDSNELAYRLVTQDAFIVL